MVRRQSSSVSFRMVRVGGLIAALLTSTSMLAELRNHVRDDLAIAVVVGDIERIWIRLSAGGLISSATALGSVGIAFEEDDLRTLGGHLQRDRSAQPLAGAADEADPVVQQTQHATPCACTSNQPDLALSMPQAPSSGMLDLALICRTILDFA